MESRRNNSYAPGPVVGTSGAWVRELCWTCLSLPPCAVFGTWPSSVILLNFGFCTTERVGSSDRFFFVSSECLHKGSSGILNSLRLFMVLLSHRHKNSGTMRRTVSRPFPSTSVPALHSVIILLLDYIFWVVDSIVKHTASEHAGRQNNNYMHIHTPNGSGVSLATRLGGPGFECLVRQVIFFFSETFDTGSGP
jgi:hypothetical protein